MVSALDDAFRALANPERRRLLIALAEHDPQADGALHVPEGIPIEGRERERLHTRLYHIHLPTLEEAGLIRWDRDACRVTRGPRFDEIRPVLNLFEGDPDELASHE